MPALADRGYIKAQLAAAIAARKRLKASAIKVFGPVKGPKILDRVAASIRARVGQ